MLPIVMPTNLRKLARTLEDRFPGRLGLLLGPTGYTDPKGLPYALDNDRFSVWSKGLVWDKKIYTKFLDKISRLPTPPLWAVVPDVVANAEMTIRDYRKWAPVLQAYDFLLAVAVQDGMTTKDVLSLHPLPDVVFVGGTTKWKQRTLTYWCRNFPRVHCARINTGHLLWGAHRAGVESTDGTGWWHVEQLEQLKSYLARSQVGLGEFNTRGFRG
jgi:hypothetical protein